MDVTLVYAIVFGAVFGFKIMVEHVYCFVRALCLSNLQPRQVSHVPGVMSCVSRMVRRHLLLPTILRQGIVLNRWSRFDVLSLLIYLGANIACLVVRTRDISEAGLRAGTLALINAIFLFASPHLSFLADRLGVSIHTGRRLHVFVALVSFVLTIFHAAIGVATKGTYELNTSPNIWAVVVRGPLPII